MGQKGSLGELSLSARRQTGELLGRRSVEPLLARETVFSPAAFPPETEPRFGSSLKYFVTVVLSFCDRPPPHTDSATWDPTYLWVPRTRMKAEWEDLGTAGPATGIPRTRVRMGFHTKSDTNGQKEAEADPGKARAPPYV